jgi:hypothetical protein
MYVGELREQLGTYGNDVWVDVMFPDDMNVYTIAGLTQFELHDGNLRVVIDITGDAPLKAV